MTDTSLTIGVMRAGNLWLAYATDLDLAIEGMGIATRAFVAVARAVAQYELTSATIADDSGRVREAAAALLFTT